MSETFESLEATARVYRSDIGFERRLIEFDLAVILEKLKGERILEMGCSNGVMTRALSNLPVSLDVVEGSKSYIDYVRKKVNKNVRFFHSLFEDFTPQGKYDAIIMASVLEHVDHPVKILRKVHSWLVSNGQLHIVVPNAYSIHRLIGVKMGIIKRPTELGQKDIEIGHKRVFTPKSLDRTIEVSGWKILEREGIFVKPLPNDQMETWPEYVLEPLLKIGKHVPEMCVHLYRNCTH